ncbi:hypothetical protein X975_21038, partial [Stegodyphus mimosarum]
MADVKDIKSALVYAMKFEVAQQATRRGHHPVRAVRVHEPVDQLMAGLDDLTRQVNALQRNTGDKKPTVKCWNCGTLGSMRRNCRILKSSENKTDDINRQLNAMRWKTCDKKRKCWNCGAEGHLRRNCRTPQSTESKIISQQRLKKQINDHIAEQSLSDSEQSRFKALKISAVCGKSNGLSINGHIHGVPSNCGERIDIEGKLNVNITLGGAAYHHTTYVADITDPCILGLDFLRTYNFSLDFKNNKLLSAFEDMTIDPQKGSSPQTRTCCLKDPAEKAAEIILGSKRNPRLPTILHPRCSSVVIFVCLVISYLAVL